MTPTFSLGCGTWGGSLTTDNINHRNLLNVKAVSRRQTPPQWFRVRSDTYFNPGALETLRTLHSEQALIVTDADTEARGVADEVRRHLDAAVRVFADVEPEPSEAIVQAGVEVVRNLRPDLIIAVGGGSAIDASKTARWRRPRTCWRSTRVTPSKDGARSMPPRRTTERLREGPR